MKFGRWNDIIGDIIQNTQFEANESTIFAADKEYRLIREFERLSLKKLLHNILLEKERVGTIRHPYVSSIFQAVCSYLEGI